MFIYRVGASGFISRQSALIAWHNAFNVQAQLAHYLERCIIIRAKIDSVEKMVHSTLGLLSAVRGYHVYRRMWTPVVGESLTAAREFGNAHDRNAVALFFPKSVLIRTRL